MDGRLSNPLSGRWTRDDHTIELACQLPKSFTETLRLELAMACEFNMDHEGNFALEMNTARAALDSWEN